MEEHEEAEAEQDTDENIPESEYKAEQEKSPAAQLPKIIREGSTVFTPPSRAYARADPGGRGLEEDEAGEPHPPRTRVIPPRLTFPSSRKP